MAVESELGRFFKVEERLGAPDYIGRWEGNVPGDFKLYILKKEVWGIPDSVLPIIIDGFVEEGYVIEGIISDKMGLSVFLGTVRPDEIVFTKTYSEAARVKGAYDNILYTGRYNKERGRFEGEYSIQGTKISGKFHVTSFKK